MIFKEYFSAIELPQFIAWNFSGFEQQIVPTHDKLLLTKVEPLKSGTLKLTVKEKGNDRQSSGNIRFKLDDVSKKEYLYKWLSSQIGETIDSIYKSEFSFGK
jgi:hypothetical protein